MVGPALVADQAPGPNLAPGACSRLVATRPAINIRIGRFPARPASRDTMSSTPGPAHTAGMCRWRRRSPIRCRWRRRTARIGRNSRSNNPGKRRPSCTTPCRPRRCRDSRRRNRPVGSRRRRRPACLSSSGSRRDRRRMAGTCRSYSRSRCRCKRAARRPAAPAPARRAPRPARQCRCGGPRPAARRGRPTSGRAHRTVADPWRLLMRAPIAPRLFRRRPGPSEPGNLVAILARS